MNAIPVVKSFTAVLIFLVSGLLWGAEKSTAEPPEILKEKCIADVKSDLSCTKPKDKTDLPAMSTYRDCIDTMNTRITSECSDKRSIKEKTADCSSAYKEWSTAAFDGGAACKAFDPTTGDSCNERIAACDAKLNNTIAPTTESGQSDTDMIMAIVQKSLVGNSGPNAGGTKACVKQFDTKELKATKKDLDQKEKELKKDIKKELDDQLKFVDEKTKKSNEIEKQIATLKKDLKKFNQTKDTEMRKQINDAAKATLDSAKKLRGLNLSIVAKNNSLAQLRFKHQTEMLDLTDERVTFSCKQQLLALKNGILNNSAEDPKSPNYSEKKALADQFRNQGTKGTADLKALLTLTQKKCFETANTKKNQTAMQFGQSQSDLENDMKEIRNQIEDENKQLALSQDNIKKIQAEADTAKSEEQKAMDTEIFNLNKEVIDNNESIKNKLELSRAQAAQLKLDIQNLVLQTNADVEVAFSDASKAIGKAEDLRVAAVKQCCAGKIKDDSCKRLESSDPSKSTNSGSSNSGIAH